MDGHLFPSECENLRVTILAALARKFPARQFSVRVYEDALASVNVKDQNSWYGEVNVARINAREGTGKIMAATRRGLIERGYMSA